MLFTQTHFLFYFLPLALLLHRFSVARVSLHYRTISCLTLFGLTLIFYGLKHPWWLIPFFVCICFDFLWASLLQGTRSVAERKWICTASIVQNLSLLGYFKYSAFLAHALGDTFGVTLSSFAFHGELPPGISFYTFESLSFVIDVYRREIQPPKRPWQFFAFIGMFPRFVAGPIVRYKDLLGQFEQYSGMQWAPGLFLFSIGLFLKGCFADSFALFVPYAFSKAGPANLLSAWAGAFAYTFQIYFDFCGYSLMAIGLGRCLGFQFPTNFNRPYHSTSFQEFWRRWHISLSTWLRDYLYVSLGGNRKGAFRTQLNLFLTMLIGGLWHGAGYTFLIWGAWHGLLLGLERSFPNLRWKSQLLQKLTTFVFVLIGWVFFKAESLTEAKRVLKAMFTLGKNSFRMSPEALHVYPVATAFCGLALIYWLILEPKIDFSKLERVSVLSHRQEIMSLVLMALGLVTVLSAFNVPFLYFQF